MTMAFTRLVTLLSYSKTSLSSMVGSEMTVSPQSTQFSILSKTFLDVVHGDSTISTVEVERALMALGYFEEATVVAVPVSESVQLCGAVVRPKEAQRAEVSLGRVRSDLEGKLDGEKRPVAMRILKQDEELPMTATGKPVKRQVIEDFFYDGDCGRDWFTPETPPPNVQCEGISVTM